jgi:hypothetical protein
MQVNDNAAGLAALPSQHRAKVVANVEPPDGCIPETRLHGEGFRRGGLPSVGRRGKQE